VFGALPLDVHVKTSLVSPCSNWKANDTTSREGFGGPFNVAILEQQGNPSMSTSFQPL
jgi:hypothetical protein